MRNFPKTVAIRIIDLYQATLSPDHGPLKHLYPHGFCRHHPTCSQYGKEMIQRHGVLSGSAKALLRVLRCTPWNKPDAERIIRGP